MKKEVLSLVIGILLMGANLFAADGDLIVNGNVGIGATNPSEKLNVNIGSDGYVFLGERTGGAQVGIYSDTTHGGLGTKSNHPLFFFTNNGNAQMTLTPAGKVGIGTSTPGAYLEINGIGPTFRIRYNGSASYWDLSHAPSEGSFLYRYNPGSGSSVVAKVGSDGTWYALSDLNLKENISPLGNPIEKIKAINGITFTWKDQSLFAGQRVGVIADEVEKVLPEAVTMNEDGNKMISYDSLIPLLIEAVKEQQKAIESLQQELAAIKK